MTRHILLLALSTAILTQSSFAVQYRITEYNDHGPICIKFKHTHKFTKHESKLELRLLTEKDEDTIVEIRRKPENIQAICRPYMSKNRRC